MIYIKLNRLILFFIAVLPIFIACQPSDEKKQLEKMDVETDEKNPSLVQFQNSVFSIPSPYQLTGIIKALQIEFNPGLLNPTHNNMKYSDNFDKALNLGVYGADLAYANMYDQIPLAINYFGVIKLITQDLGLDHAFDGKTINRIEKNMTNKDSLLFIMSSSYRKADAFLKENQREETGVLILAGGWIESLYLITKLAEENQNTILIARIGEHKYPLKNLIKMLQPYANTEKYNKLLEAFSDLDLSFEQVKFIYIYKPPQTSEKDKITFINSTSESKITKESLAEISKKVIGLRKFIIQEN